MRPREIKFRGFSERQIKWLYGNLITKLHPQYTEDKIWRYLIHDGALSAEVVETESVGQFTGLLDKNGKECYEGDILKSNTGRIGEVIYEYGAFHYLGEPLCYNLADGSMTDTTEWAEIIGNIYQNADLLK